MATPTDEPQAEPAPVSTKQGARPWRFRPAHVLDPRLPGRQGAGTAFRHERVSGLADARVRPSHEAEAEGRVPACWSHAANGGGCCTTALR
jgi:hypothetical protein